MSLSLFFRRAIAVAALVILGLLIIASFGGISWPPVETSPKRYPKLLKKWQEMGLADHFPQTIPPEADSLKLSAFPGFLQGGAWLQIRMALPPSVVERVFGDASRQAKAFYDGGNSTTLVNRETDGLWGTSFYTSGLESSVFPEDYRIFVFDARPHQPGEVHPWNHGTSRGVVISKKRNEVIYYADSW